jgi:transposase InsO family protein
VGSALRCPQVEHANLVRDAKTRLAWVRLYEETGNAGVVCRRCGISRPTLRKWWRRYQTLGQAGLVEQSRAPLRPASRKVCAHTEALILDQRRTRRLGVKRLRNELIRRHGLVLSLDTIHRVLVRHGERYLKQARQRRKGTRKYSRPIPGDRVQMDVRKIAPGVYQYTAIDDCSRYKVLGVYPRRNAKSTLGFLERVVEEMPFPIQRIQTDRGLEFFAENVQRRLMEWAIKFRPVPPRSPHLNGKVERAQRSDLEEFWVTVDPKAAEIEDRLAEWQHFWNWERSHMALGGKTPIDRVCERLAKAPLGEEVDARYDPQREKIRVANYNVDMALIQLK